MSSKKETFIQPEDWGFNRGPGATDQPGSVAASLEGQPPLAPEEALKTELFSIRKQYLLQPTTARLLKQLVASRGRRESENNIVNGLILDLLRKEGLLKN